MFMKCPRKYGRIYDHKGAMSTTNGHLPRALPVTKQQRHLPSASMEIRTSLVDQTVKRLPTMWEVWVRPLGWEDPLEKEMAPHSSTLAWKIPWMEEPSKLQSRGRKSWT